MGDHGSRKKPDPGQTRKRSGRPRLQHGPRESRYDAVHLSDDTVKELRATARPGKGEILVKVFADAVAAFAAEDYDEAIRLGEQAKHIALRSIAAREFLGLAYYRSERWSEAARELSAFRRLAGSTEQNPVIADCYRAMRKPEKAIEYCDEVLPGRVDEAVYYEAQIVAAGALADMRRMDEAIGRLEALDLRPEVARLHHLRVWYSLADLLERRGRYTHARELFEAVAAADAELTDAPARARRLATK
jgi:tetratricopeptide (TPR) repeat protein